MSRRRLISRLKAELRSSEYLFQYSLQDSISHDYEKKLSKRSGMYWREKRYTHHPLVEAYRQVCKAGVPTWFLKRHIDFIVRECMYQPLRVQYSVMVGRDSREELDIATQEHGAKPYVILDHSTYYQETTRTRHIPVTIDGEKYEKLVQAPFVTNVISGYQEVSFIPSYVIGLWRLTRDKHIGIFGMTCKKCKKETKHTDIVCNEMDKYVGHICTKCIKKFCDITEKLDAVMAHSKHIN